MRAKRPSKFEKVKIIKGWFKDRDGFIFPDERMFPADECEILIEVNKKDELSNNNKRKF